MKNDTYESPNSRADSAGGAPALNLVGEALVSQECHAQWHRAHPDEPCPPGMFDNDNWENIERGNVVMHFGGGGTVQPGDAFVTKREE